MGVPILRPEPDPLPRLVGYFSARVTQNEVGSYSADTFVRQQRQASSTFTPLVSIDGGVLQPAWAGQRLHWLYGGLNEGGVFFRVHSCGQLEYLGTARHPTPDWLSFDDDGAVQERPVSPGYVDFMPQDPNDEDSADEDGYQNAPAVHVGGELTALSSAERPTCLRCRDCMHYIGQLETDVFSDDLQEASILLFYCHDCRIQCCLDQ